MDRLEALFPGVPVLWTPNMVERPPRPPSWPGWSGTLEVLFLGSLIPRKGIQELVQAVGTSTVSVRLTIAGSGHLSSALRRQAQALEATGSIRFCGHVRRPAVGPLLAAHHLLALPTHAEQMPNAVLEAMASGRAVVTSPVDGCLDLIRSGEEGWLVPPGDAASLRRVLEDASSAPDRLERMGHSAFRRSDDFSVPRGVARLTEAWNQALDGGGV